MKKQTRIGLIVLVTLMLTMTLTIPGLADKLTAPDTCGLKFYITNVSNNLFTTESIPGGEFTIVGWVDGTLINTCTGGGIPFGEPVEGKPGSFTWLSYADLKDLDAWDWTPASATITADSADVKYVAWVWDTDNRSYKTTYWEITIYPNGNYEFYEEYTP